MWSGANGAAPLTSCANGQGPPPEKLLQAIWLHQRLKRDQLKTLEGRPIRVFIPVLPVARVVRIFRGAIVQIGDEKPVSGDVEIDLQAGGAGMRTDMIKTPIFRKFVLHVLWAAPRKIGGGSSRFSLWATYWMLRSQNLALALEHDAGLPESLRGKMCRSPP